MNKRKTHKGMAKRVQVTASGKIRHKRAGAGHLMSCKNGNRKRHLRRPSFLKGAIAKTVAEMLGV
jgi:large subunit ribosomal protein L35